MINFKNSKYIKSAPNISFSPNDKNLNEIIFVGKSNVGKSSLINALCSNSSLAKVSSTPGRTQYLNYFNIDNKFYLIDAPGYGFVKNKKLEFSEMMDSIFTSKNLVGIVFVLDSRRELSEIDKVFYNYLIDKNLPFIIALNKSDKLNQSEKAHIIKEIHKYFKIVKDNEMIFISSTNKENINILKDKLNYLIK